MTCPEELAKYGSHIRNFVSCLHRQQTRVPTSTSSQRQFSFIELVQTVQDPFLRDLIQSKWKSVACALKIFINKKEQFYLRVSSCAQQLQDAPERQSSDIHFLKNINLFIFGCVGSSLLCAGFLQLRRVGSTLHCSVRASLCGGFSCGARALGAWASAVVARELSCCGSRAVEHRLSSCGSRTQLLCGMWNLCGPGLEPLFPALAGGFLTTAPPGKSDIHF